LTVPRQNDPKSITVATPREIIITPEAMPPSHEISAVSLLNIVLRHRWLILFLTLAFGFYAGLSSIRSPKRWTAEAQFMPKGARGQSQLGGLAAQFGINIGSGEGQSSQLYSDLLETKSLLWPVAQKTYRINTDSGVVEGDLIKLFNIKHPRAAVRKARVIGALQGAIKPTLAAKTGVITVLVSAGNPELALQIAQNLLDQVNVYNLGRRQEQAAAERNFVERQLGEKQAELRAAEQELESFLEGNRMWRTSPQLSLEYGRLERRMEMRNTLYSNLLQAYETAKIEEVRDLPVITVVEAPELPLDPDRRGGVRKTLIGMLVGFALGCLIAFVSDRLARNKATQSNDYIEFERLRREALGDLTHPWRPVARAMRSRRKQ
jgi:uncharacterized protein involved in exopolysaccharide biosynthesis